MAEEYEPRSLERLFAILKAEDPNPRSWQSEAAAHLAVKWRCFHCGDEFAAEQEHEAGIHFGADEAATCACVLPHEQHLVEHIRELEEKIAEYRQDRDHVMRSIMTIEATNRTAVQDAEEQGYGRGLRDGMAVTGGTIDNVLKSRDELRRQETL